jgi:SPW repeat
MRSTFDGKHRHSNDDAKSEFLRRPQKSRCQCFELNLDLFSQAEEWSLRHFPQEEKKAMAAESTHDARVRVLSGINALLGLWLIVTPWIIGAPHENAAINGMTVGALTSIFALVRFGRKHTSILSWINLLLGAWLAMAPWVLGEPSGDARTWNYVIVGMLIAAMETYSLTSTTTQPNWRQSETGPRKRS